MKIYLKVNEFEKTRLKLGFTKIGVAKKIEIGRSTLEDWYKGKVVSPKNANRSAELLGMTFDDLFEIHEKA